MSRIKPAREVRAEYAISAQQARNVQLAVQGLLNPPRARATRARVLEHDPAHAAAADRYDQRGRAQSLSSCCFRGWATTKSRWLDDLLRRGDIFECWAHEACFAPAEDFALHRSDMSHRAHHWAQKGSQRIVAQHRAEMDRLLAHIRENGEVKASRIRNGAPRRKRLVGLEERKALARSAVRARRIDDRAPRKFPARVRS